MTLCVSNFNNAELDSLLKDLFREPSTDNAESSAEVYSSIDAELSDLKLKIVLLSKQLVDKTNEVEAKDEELSLVSCKLDNAEKANERLVKKIISYENIIEGLKPFNDKKNEVNDVSMTSVENEKVTSVQSCIPSEAEKPGLNENLKSEMTRTQKVMKAEDKSKRSKCQFENTGTCRKKNCRNFHPKKTCQNYSNYGVCSFRGCDLRHPWGVCHIWQQHGACFYGDKCRNRHPIQLRRHENANFDCENRFLGWNNSHHMKPHLRSHHPLANFERGNSC